MGVVMSLFDSAQRNSIRKSTSRLASQIRVVERCPWQKSDPATAFHLSTMRSQDSMQSSLNRLYRSHATTPDKSMSPQAVSIRDSRVPLSPTNHAWLKNCHHLLMSIR